LKRTTGDCFTKRVSLEFLKDILKFKARKNTDNEKDDGRTMEGSKLSLGEVISVVAIGYSALG
jgi:hypothetical protein